MPEISNYKKGYNLTKGLIIAGYKLESIDIEHVEEKRYESYTYPTQLLFVPTANALSEQKLVDEFTKYVSEDKTIYTSYGNLYLCNFESIQEIKGHLGEDGSVVITCTGGCHRVYD
jgi:carbohydrate-binding DOMON domain-containing protein